MPYRLPLDGNGLVTPHDHPDIGNECGVIRRVSLYQVVKDPKAPTGQRLSSAVFQGSSDTYQGMSVDIQSFIEAVGTDAIAYVSNPPWIGSVRLIAQQFRNEGFLVGSDPLPDQPHHGEVWGNFTKSKQKLFLKSCQWFVEIDGVSLG